MHPTSNCLQLGRFRHRFQLLRLAASSNSIPMLYQASRKRVLLDAPPHVWEATSLMEGWILREEAGLLYWSARLWPVQGSVVELGSWQGRSTAILALAGRQVYAVDAWDMDLPGLPQTRRDRSEASTRFSTNIGRLGLESHVTKLRDSTDALGRRWSTTCAILFVDAGHEYAQVCRDLEAWLPHLEPKGLLLMHDVLAPNHPGVMRAASRILGRRWKVVASAGSIVGFEQIGSDSGCLWRAALQQVSSTQRSATADAELEPKAGARAEP